MASETDPLTVYRELADRYDRLNQFSMRDRFLMLAAGAALDAGEPAEAERLRGRLLQHNRHHMLRPYGSFEEAVGAPDVQTYLNDLKANYPPEIATQLLESLREGKSPPVPSKHLSQRRPAPAPSPIPPTAPVVDPYQPPARPARESPIPYKMVEEVAVTAPLPADLSDLPRLAQQPTRPRTHKALPPAPDETQRPAMRHTVPVPRPQPEPTVTPSIPAPAPEPQQEEADGTWLCLLLTGVAAIVGVAVGGFTIARPFLPPGWLP